MTPTKSDNFQGLLKAIFYGVGVNPLALSHNVAALTTDAKSRAESRGLDPNYVTQKRVRRFLNSQVVVQLHKPATGKFVRTPYYSPSLHHLWLADTAHIDDLPLSRADPKYFLLVMDFFSRQLFGTILKTITGAEITRAFDDIIQQAGTKPSVLGTDRGTEFLNDTFNSFLTKKAIGTYTSYSAHKISPIERAIRSVKSLLQGMVEVEEGDRTYKELFPVALHGLNNREHSALPKEIKCPANVTKENQHLVLEKVRKKRRQMFNQGLSKFEFNLGDRVRISKRKDLFEKSHTSRWSKVIYQVNKRIGSVPPRYMLKNAATGEIILGAFYKQEMQLVPRETKLPEKSYKAARIRARRNRGERTQVLADLEGRDIDTRYLYWLDEETVQMPKPRSPSPLIQKPETPSLRRTSRVHKAPRRMDL